MLKVNDKIALVVCSNGKKIEDRARLEKLEVVLKEMSLVPVFSTYVYEEKFGRSALAKWRANELMKFYEDDSIKAIFDISGGDLANEVLDYLDYEIICKNNKPFFGYSDLTTVLNAITTITQQATYLYQIMNIIDNVERRADFEKTLLDNKVLFLEGMSTTIEGLITLLTQLKQIGVFNKISGLLLGTFTKIEQNLQNEDIYEILKDFVPENIPIAKTTEVGHSKDSKILVIGQKIKL